MHKRLTPILAAAALALSGSAAAQISGSFGADTPVPSATDPAVLEDATPRDFVADPKEVFGTDAEGVTWIDPVDFQPELQPEGSAGSAYYFTTTSSARTEHQSFINAPAGVTLQSIGCHFKIKSAPGSPLEISLFRSESGSDDSPEGRWHAGTVTLPNYPTSYPAYRNLVKNSIGYTMTHQVGGDAANRQKFHFTVRLTSDYSLYGCEVRWKRKMSPAPGTASFSDVPKGNSYFQAVEALAASGITSGCGGGKFCPDDVVTRKQMAVFLAKALGLHHPR